MDSATVMAAWWGAVVATLAFLWEIFQWFKSGPRVQVRAKANMEPVNFPGLEKNEKYIFVEVTNAGDRATTITHFCAYIFNDCIKRLVNKPEKKLVILNNSGFGPPIPFFLDSGQRWTGGILQNQFDEKLISDGKVYACIFHTASSKPVLSQVT
jgi:hypothetical protein